jgi:hypothetical protein
VAWFWPAVVVFSLLLIAAAWLLDRSIARRGIAANHRYDPREARREARSRMLLFRRFTWIPSDLRPQGRSSVDNEDRVTPDRVPREPPRRRGRHDYGAC